MNTRLIPYGYKMENGVLLVNDEEAEQVRRIFEMRVNDMGVYAIGKMLYEEQIPFIHGTRLSRKQVPFFTSRFTRVQRVIPPL